MGQFLLLFKTLIKSSLDNYVLPGTLSGTEILWLYLIHWKRDVAALMAATLCLLASNLELSKPERVVSGRSAVESQE